MGGARGFAQLPQDFEAVGFRQHDIEQDKVGPRRFYPRKEGRGGVKAFGLKPGGAQGVEDQFPDIDVVFDAVNGSHKQKSFLSFSFDEGQQEPAALL